MTIEEAIKDIEECVKPNVGGKSLEIALLVMKSEQAMEKDRDRFFNLYHNLFKESREFEIKARANVEKLTKDKELFLKLLHEKITEIEELRKELDRCN